MRKALLPVLLIACLSPQAAKAAPIGFSSPLSLKTPFTPGPAGLVAIGDVDGDGRNDLIATAPSFDKPGSTIVFLDNGAGGYTPTAPQSLGTLPAKGLVADFDGDRRADVLAVPDERHFQVLKGQADGSFTAGQVIPGGSFDSPLIADADGDGALDIVNVRSKDVVTFRGDGHGAFGPGIVTKTTSRVSARVTLVGDDGPATIDDFTGDGKVDIAFGAFERIRHAHARSSLHGALVVRPGTGDGHFGKAVVSLLGTGRATMWAPQAADVNGDGRLDLIGGGFSQEDQVEAAFVALSKGRGRFGKAACRGFSSCKPFHNESGTYGNVDVATGDFNADHRVDFAAAEFDLSYPRILRGNGRGGFASQTQKFGVFGNYSVAAGDLGGGSGDDLVFLGGDRVTVLRDPA